MSRPLSSLFRFSLVALLLALALLPAPASRGSIIPAPGVTQAQVSNPANRSFASAVSCLSEANPAFAVSTYVDTMIYSPDLRTAPAIKRFDSSAARSLVAQANIGSVYGLAYDAGNYSGQRRILAAAYLKRLDGFGPGGIGAIYAIDPDHGTTSQFTTVNHVGSVPGRLTTGTDDHTIPWIGKVGIGDIEITPDGRELYVMNLHLRRIERFDLRSGAYQGSIGIPFGGGIDTDTNAVNGIQPAFQGVTISDLRPFALEFWPQPLQTADGLAWALVIGVVDSGETTGAAPTAYVLTRLPEPQRWVLSLTQLLDGGPFDRRVQGASGFTNVDGWYAWRNVRPINGGIGAAEASGNRLVYPQPILSDIQFTADGSRMFLGFRDRTGDQTFADGPPVSHFSSVAQGDTLVYANVGGWQLQTASHNDYFDDDNNSEASGHHENHMGALATAYTGAGPMSRERVVSTSLLGASRAGAAFYDQAGGPGSTLVMVQNDAYHPGGKSASLGDVERLCTAAFASGVVWHDTDGNGVRAVSEPSMSNVEVWAVDPATNSHLATAVTDADGNYAFALPPGKRANIFIPSHVWQPGHALHGYRITRQNQGGDDTRDSDMNQWATIAIDGGEHGLLWRDERRSGFDVGVVRFQNSAMIGDRVWIDTNGNGLQDGNETAGVPNVTVVLHRDAGSTIFPSMASYPQTTTTRSDGSYEFRAIDPGAYWLEFRLPAGMTFTVRNAGDDHADSDPEPGGGWTEQFSVNAAPPPAYAGQMTSNDNKWDAGVLAGADVAVSINTPDTILPGQELTYRISWWNHGPLTANNFTLSHTLPAGVSFVRQSGWFRQEGQTLIWGGTGSVLQAGWAGNIDVTVRVDGDLALGYVLNFPASISTSSNDPNPANNTASDTTTVVRDDAWVAQTCPATALIGDEYTCTLTFGNRGNYAHPMGYWLADYFSYGGQIVRTSPALSGSGSNVVDWGYQHLAPGVGRAISVVVRSDPARPVDSIAVLGSIEYRAHDGNPANHWAAATTRVLRPDLSIDKNGPVTAYLNDTLVYAIDVRNSGDGQARDVVITDTLPEWTVFSSANLSGLHGNCAYDSATRQLACTLSGELAPGAAGRVTIRATIDPNVPRDVTQLTNTAAISTSTGGDRNPGDESDSVTTTLLRPDVYTTINTAAVIGVGDSYATRVDYGNSSVSGNAVADDVVLTITLPPHTTFDGFTSNPGNACSESGGQITCDLGPLTDGASGGVEYSLTPDNPLPAGVTALTQVAVISTSTPGDDPANNRAEASTAVVQPIPIPELNPDFRIAIHSTLDPLSNDGADDNAVYVSDHQSITWPAGEVLDFTPRVTLDGLPSQPFPYETRAAITGWSFVGATADGVERPAGEADDRGVSGCRARARVANGSGLAGCTYAYIDGENPLNQRAPRESEMASQAHIFWALGLPLDMRDDVYVFDLAHLQAITLRVQVRVAIDVVNRTTGEVVESDTQIHDGAYTVNLVVPRSAR